MQFGALTKAAVEGAVLLAQRWILARLRDETFFSLGALNQAIRVLLDELNDRPLKKLGVSRRALYEQLDRPALQPLPATRYVLAQWKLCRLNIDYHVIVERHAYSVPFQLLREQVESATPRRPSRPSSRAGACRRTGAATTDSRPPWPSTCRAPTAPTPILDTIAPHPLGREGRTGDR